MKSFKLLLLLLTITDLYFFSGLLKYLGHMDIFFINDSIWLLISPILFLVTFFLCILEIINYKDSLLKKSDFKFKVILFLNILILLTLTVFSLNILNSATDGGLFSGMLI